MNKNIFYAHSGGVTPVLNATACGVIEAARNHASQLGQVLIGKNGILGALKEELIETQHFSSEQLQLLKQTPSSAFGSCRHKLKSVKKDPATYQRLFQVFKAHDIGYFLYHGGNDSQDTTHKIAEASKTLDYPLICIGLPKTIDNDLAETDNCPGFGSVAKYVALSIREAGLDVASMAATSTKVFILEVMGRHTGWIAAASGLASEKEGDPPHLILFPEVPFTTETMLVQVKHCVQQYGYCTIVASEGIRYADGCFVSESDGAKDAFGHAQLGGVAPYIARRIQKALGYKYHWAVADYLQRSARHIASQVDVDQSYHLGKYAVEAALARKHTIMLTLVREQTEPYQWSIGEIPLQKIANIEKSLPPHFISDNTMHISKSCRRYLSPLIQGEAYPTYRHGLPHYFDAAQSCVLAKKNCPPIVSQEKCKSSLTA